MDEDSARGARHARAIRSAAPPALMVATVIQLPPDTPVERGETVLFTRPWEMRAIWVYAKKEVPDPVHPAHRTTPGAGVHQGTSTDTAQPATSPAPGETAVQPQPMRWVEHSPTHRKMQRTRDPEWAGTGAGQGWHQLARRAETRAF